jgi:hypothetical protein
MDAAESFYTRAALERQAYEVGQSSSAAGQAYKEFLRRWDAAVVETIDDAAAKAGKSGAADEIRAWKREWQLASAAEKAAEGGSERVLRNNIIGLRAGVGMAAGFATGNPIGGLVSGLGGKILGERGAAAGAYLLGRVADSGSLTQLVAKVDAQIGKAAHGLLTAPERKPLPEMAQGKPRVRAEAAMRLLSALQADPEGTSEHIARQTDPVGATSPELAAALNHRMSSSLAFLSTKMPVAADRDPLDPHPAPRMTDAQAAEFARYAWYAERPARFFEEVAHGKLTPEGAETAQALMPAAFAELQQRMMDAIATHMARGRSVPFQQRLVIGAVLDIPAVPAQRPEHMLTLQKNVLPSPGDLQSQPAPSRRSASIPTQRNALDRLEANGPGRK